MPEPSRVATFRNPLVAEGADPWMTFHEGFYYLSATNGAEIRVRQAAHIGQLRTAPETFVWRDAAPARSKLVWAPEFHFIDGRWYGYYAASDGIDYHHRLHVLEANESHGTPLGPYHYKGQLQTDPANGLYAIDPSVFTAADGASYLLWAGEPGHVLYIQRLLNPWTTTGRRTQILASGFGCAQIREAPFAIARGDKVYLFYSACETRTPDYKVGLLVASVTGDLLNPRSWVQHPAPVLTRSDRHSVYGPGHNSLFRSPDGAEDWIVYHAKTTAQLTEAGRSPRAQKITWQNGLPVIGEPSALFQDIPVPAGDLS